MSASGHEWQGHVEELSSSIDACYKQLDQIWMDCGFENEVCTQRRNVVMSHVKALLNDMVKEETRHKVLLISKVEDLLKELSALGKELQCEIPTFGFENLPLIKMEKGLRMTVEEHRKIKQIRLDKLTDLKKQEKQVCKLLGIDPLAVSNKVPTEQDLEQLEHYLRDKQHEQAQLERIFNEKRNEIIALAKELEWMPSLQFEKTVLQDRASFVYSSDNMEELENFYWRLEKDLKERKALITELHAKLTELWDRLGQDIEYRETFLSSCRGYGMKTVDKLKEEITRLEEIKRQNVKKFVEFTRSDLDTWWTKCRMSRVERQAFLPFYSSCYTEDLLELHELEIQKVKRYYEANIDIFQLVDEWYELWDKVADIENRAHDKNRLFANRGGQLLLEERERKQIQKKLPKIEAALQKRLASYEKEHGTPFLVDGEVLADMMGKQWKQHWTSKEQEKQARKKLRDQETSAESRFGARSLTKDSTLKRKRCDTPGGTPHSVKHTKLAPVASGSLRKPGSSRSGKAKQDPARLRKVVRKSLRLAGLQSSQHTSSSGDDVLARELSIASTALSYTHFEGQLEVLSTGSKCRSSLKSKVACPTPTKPSRQALTPRNFGTPMLSVQQPQTPSSKSQVGRIPIVTPRLTANRARTTPITTPCLTTKRVKLPIIF